MDENKAESDAGSPTNGATAKDKINILSFDGGGSRGVMEAFILKDVFNFLTIFLREPAKLEFLCNSQNFLDTIDARKELRSLLDSCEQPIHPTEAFDFIVGTSTGSLITFALVGGKKVKDKREPMEVEEIIQMYKDCIKKIFEKKAKVEHWTSWFKNKALELVVPFPVIPYTQEGLEKLLLEHFGEIRMRDFPKTRGCVAGAVARKLNNEIPGNMVLFTTSRGSNGITYRVVDVLKASSAAPIYFKTPVKIGCYAETFIDGGVGGNCPLAQAIPAVGEIFGENTKITTVLSIAPPKSDIGAIPDENQWMYWLNYFPSQVTDGSAVYYDVSKTHHDIRFQRLFPKSKEANFFKMDEQNVEAMISCMRSESIEEKSYFIEIIQAACTIATRFEMLKPDNKRVQICEQVFKSSPTLEPLELELAQLWLEMAEKNDADSFCIAEIKMNLGDCYSKLDSNDKAIEYYQESLKIYDGQPRKMTTLNNKIGWCYMEKNSYTEAESHFKKSLDILIKHHIQDTSLFAATYNNLGDCFLKEEKIDNAITNYNQTLDLEEINKEIHSDELTKLIANAYHGLGTCCLKQSKYEEAKDYYEKSLSLRSNRDETDSKAVTFVEPLNPLKDYHSTPATHNNLGISHLMMYNYQAAIDEFKKSLEMKIKFHGKDAIHSTIAISYTNLGNCYMEMKEYDMAIYHFDKSLKMNINIYGDESTCLCMAETYNNLSICYFKEGNCDLTELITYLKKSLKIKEGHGKNRKSIAASHNNLGRCFMKKGKYDEAIECHNHSLDIKVEIFGDDSTIAMSYQNLGECYEGKGDNVKAKYYFDKVKVRPKELFEKEFCL